MQTYSRRPSAVCRFELDEILRDVGLLRIVVAAHINGVLCPGLIHHSELEQAYLDCGAAKNTKFGDAACILCDANELFRVTRHVLAPDPEAFVTEPVIPAQRWKELCTETL